MPRESSGEDHPINSMPASTRALSGSGLDASKSTAVVAIDMSAGQTSNEQPSQLLAELIGMPVDTRDAFVLLLIEHAQNSAGRTGRPDFAALAQSLLPVKGDVGSPTSFPSPPAEDLLRRVKRLSPELRLGFVLGVCGYLRDAATANGRTDFLAAARNILLSYTHRPTLESSEQEALREQIVKDLSGQGEALSAGYLLDSDEVAKRLELLAGPSSSSAQG